MSFVILCILRYKKNQDIQKRIEKNGEFAKTRRNIINKWDEWTIFIIVIIFLRDGTSNSIQ